MTSLAPKLAVQLYTVRDFLTTAPDLADTFARLKAIGYSAVQLSAVAAMNGDSPQVTAKQAKQMLDDNGLKPIATHRSWESLAGNADAEIEFHHAVGCSYAAIGGVPGNVRDAGADGYKKWADEAVPVIAKLKAAGIQFGYHNHAFEFERIPGSTKTLYDIIVDAGGDMLLEMDVYWVEHAGFNPVRVIEKAHGRLPVIHIKDKEVVSGQPVMAPIGEGNFDWAGLIPALEAAGTEWYAVEQDECRRDPFDCLTSSFNFLSNFPLP